MVSNYIQKNPQTNHCIVLDLDSTLLFTQEDDDLELLKSLKIMDPKNISLRNRTYYLSVKDSVKKGDGESYEFWGVTRPHLKQFLLFCFSYFKVVAVWSAGQPSYVHKIVEHLFKGIQKPHIVFTYKNCDHIDDYIYKPLDRIFKEMKDMNIKNTFALDDTESTFSRNETNGILIPKYEPNPDAQSLMEGETSLEKLRYWFQRDDVMNSKDIRKLDKDNIFNVSIDKLEK